MLPRKVWLNVQCVVVIATKMRVETTTVSCVPVLAKFLTMELMLRFTIKRRIVLLAVAMVLQQWHQAGTAKMEVVAMEDKTLVAVMMVMEQVVEQVMVAPLAAGCNSMVLCLQVLLRS